MSNKHAFLIMAHHELDVLKALLFTLDHGRCDFFLHIDSKSSIKPAHLEGIVQQGRLFFTRQTDVHWGGYSQINAELVLLQEAIHTDTYAYYHLLTGVDLPLKPVEDILSFFDACGSVEFISFNRWSPKDYERVLFTYPYQDRLYRGFLEKKVRRIGVLLQRLFRYKRATSIEQFGIGSAYFDITDYMARYVCSKQDWIAQHFKQTFCADEVFLQTIYLAMPRPNKRYESAINDLAIEKTYQDVVRAIDWFRGSPYTYTLADWPFLKQSNCLFARKFSSQKDKDIINHIVTTLRP